MRVLSVGLMFCDVLLSPVPENIMQLDNSPIQPVSMYTGGDALTVAVVLSKLGVPTSLIGMIGKDTNGRFVLEELKKNNVDISKVIEDESQHTSVSYVLIGESGERHFLVDANINQLFKSSHVPDEAICEADLVFFGSAAAMAGMTDDEVADLFCRAHKFGKITALDASIIIENVSVERHSLVDQTLKETDIFIPSFEEASYLAGQTDYNGIIDFFSRYKLKVFGIKLGDKGCILTDFKETVRIPCCQGMNVADTTGAGDCFMGGFLCAYLKGAGLAEAGELASAVAAFGVSQRGASTGVPDLDTVQNYIKNKDT